MNGQELEAMRRVVRELCGIALDPSKEYLIESRLGEIKRWQRCHDYLALAALANDPEQLHVREAIVEAITTKETLFFRDQRPFEVLAKHLIPKLAQLADQSGRRSLRVWSAACSTGQEPYSIAMTLTEAIPDLADWDVEIVATDISSLALRQAEQGCYRAAEVQRGLCAERLDRYFEATAAGWRIRENLRRMVRFRRMNLLEPNLNLGRFDVIFCRNVLIYFDPADRQRTRQLLTRQLAPWGALLIGSSESFAPGEDRLEPCYFDRSVYYHFGTPPADAQRLSRGQEDLRFAAPVKGASR